MIDRALLDDHPLLKGLSEESTVRLAHRASRRRLRRGEVLWHAGEPSRGLWLLREGAVDVVRPRGADGRADLIHREGPGGSLGEVPLLAGGAMPATAVARHPGDCIILHRADVTDALRASSELAHRLLERLARRVQTLVGRLDRLRGSSVLSRLAAHLVREHDRIGGEPFSLMPRQADVAQELGTVREVVVRYLARLQRSGLIRRVGRGRWQVLNRDGLAALVPVQTLDFDPVASTRTEEWSR